MNRAIVSTMLSHFLGMLVHRNKHADVVNDPYYGMVSCDRFASIGDVHFGMVEKDGNILVAEYHNDTIFRAYKLQELDLTFDQKTVLICTAHNKVSDANIKQALCPKS